MYKIGELSRLCRLPVKTLRYYDSQGLLAPDRIDPFTGYRYYTAARLADCHRILALKELGFSLEEIRQQLRASTPADAAALLEAKGDRMRRELARLQARLSRLDDLCARMRKEDTGLFSVVVKRGESWRCVLERGVFPHRQAALERLAALRRELPVSLAGSRDVLINYETEWREEGLDLAVGVELAGPLPAGCPYRPAEIAAGDMAALVCRREEAEEAYTALTAQLEALHCQAVGAFREVYYDDGTMELLLPVCRLSDSAAPPEPETLPPFMDDPEAVGKWEFRDAVPSEEQFCLRRPKYSGGKDFWLKELYFLPGGQPYWIVAGWTKGLLLTSWGYPKSTLRHTYRIEERDGETLLFLHMREEDLAARGGKPLVYVYRKVSDKAFDTADIRRKDKTALPFVDDPALHGGWRACDLVEKPEDFRPGEQRFPREGLYFTRVEFFPEGKATAVYGDQPPYALDWTKDALLDKRRSLAEEIRRHRLEGREYLFIQWKSGDYIYGGRPPQWYVFIRE